MVKSKSSLIIIAIHRPLCFFILYVTCVPILFIPMRSNYGEFLKESVGIKAGGLESGRGSSSGRRSQHVSKLVNLFGVFCIFS